MTITNLSGNKGKSEQTSVHDSKVNYQQILAEDGVLYEPQSFSLNNAYILNHLRKQISDIAISKIEGLIALYSALSEVQTYKGFMGVLTLYIKTHSTASVLSQVQNIASSLFSGLTPQSSDKPSWLRDLSLAGTNWKLLVNSPSFSKVSRVLSLLVTLGVTERKSINLGNFELFAIEAQTKQASAVDLLDAVIDTVVYFAEGAYQCFLTGSLKPLLFSTSDVIALEEAFIKKVEEWEFVRNGNLERFNGKSESQFDKELDDLIDKLNTLYKTIPSGTEKKIVQQKWEQLSKIRAEFVSVRISGGLRKAPYCVKIYGDSGVGKSTFADITMATVLKSMGLPSTSNYVCTLNESDKYMSTYRSYITGIKMDDYGNTKMDFWETSPSDWIIKICNNIREYAVMADIANKGKITIEPGCLTITTNVEDMHASKCSYNSMSILRRAHTHVELNVRPDFLTNNMLDSQKVIDKFGNLDQVNDIWLVTLKKPMGDSNNSQNFSTFDIIKKDISVFEYMDYLIGQVRKHNAAQNCIVNAFKEPSDLVSICSECHKCSVNCVCKSEPQFGERLAHSILEKTNAIKLDFTLKRVAAENKLEDLAIKELISLCDKFLKSPYSYWTSWLPESWFQHPFMSVLVNWWAKDDIAAAVQNSTRTLYAQYMLCTLVSYLWFGRGVALLFSIVYGLYTFSLISRLKVAEYNNYMSELHRRRGTLNAAFVSAREKHAHYACGIFAGLSVLYGVAKLVQALKQSLAIQGTLQPFSVDDIRKRDAESNPWSQTRYVLPKSEEYLAGNDATVNAMKKVVAQINIGDKFSGALWLQTHIILFPLHMLPNEVCEARVDYRGMKIRFILNPNMCYKLENKDAVLAYVPNSGPLRNIVPFFMEEACKVPMSAMMVGLDEKQSFFTAKLFWQYVHAVHNGFAAFAGSHYELLKYNTFNGMCMSPIVTQNGKGAILGVHIGGVAGTPRGCGMSLTSVELNYAITQLYNISNTYIRGPQSQDIDDVVYDKNIVVHQGVHVKCPSNFITGNCDIELYGSVTGRNTYHSEVIETPISPLVTEICGVPNQWGPPKFRNPVELPNGKIDQQMWKPWFESLEVCSKPSIGFDPVEVERAMEDYMCELRDVFEQQSELWKQDIRPLTDLEVVSGIDGKRFIDAMVSSTSMGYPLNGPKNKYLIELEPNDTHASPRTFKKEIWDEVNNLLAKADANVSLNQIFGASLKDEPTKKSKDKVRVFQAAPVALQILIRKYFLPLARFLSVNPLIAECAVGINAHGPEWHELSCFMAKFGDDRIIAGDYSKYDLRMPAQLTLSAFSILIRFAIMSGNYTSKDVRRMFVIAHEVCTPLVAYNGTLMRFIGTNPSGQNLTVYINSIVNSLLHRLAFNDVYGTRLVDIGKELGLERPARFRDLVALATYGDDAKGSVRVGYDEFNHVSMAKYLDRNDMKFTMPDKESEPVPFMNRYKADFLKRADRFDSDLGHFVGMLDENSIFKSLHAIIKSKVVTPTDVSAMNIEGALREWFYHGRDVFELRRQQMREIADRAELFVRDLDKDFDDRVRIWKDKYVPQSGSHVNLAEDALKVKVKQVLGTPTLCDEPILIPNLGRPDMVYVHQKFIMVVETKVLNGRRSSYKKVVFQATKYATAIHILRPDATVIGMIYTENGFEVVKHFGDYVCPKQYVKVLDASIYNNDAFLR